jgi:hypothetical protein
MSTKLKIEAPTAQEICRQFPLSEPGQAQLQPAMAPLDFVDALISHAAYRDAIEFLARALPKREAIWWSCLCARQILEARTRPELITCVQAAEDWVHRPTEENRRKAEAAGTAIGDSHPGRWTALAAFWSGGSMAPPGAPEVEPSNDFSAKAVAGAILMAAGLDPKESAARYKLFLAYGRDIAVGGAGHPPATT